MRLSAADYWSRARPHGAEFEGSMCLILPNKPNRAGYVRIPSHGRLVSAHRLLFELISGPIPSSLELDHLCRNRACVNPWHLEPVTRRENVIRGIGIPAMNAKKNSCRFGHEFSVDSRGRRFCRECGRVRYRAYTARKRKAAKPA